MQQNYHNNMIILWIPLAAILGLLLYVFYHFVIKIYLVAASFKKMDPALQIYVHPFTGILGLFNSNIQHHGDSHHFVKELVKKNPNQNAFMTNVGSRPYLILCEAQLIKELSMNPKRFKKFNLFKHSSLSYTKGIFFSEDENWNSQRGIIRHSFNHDSLKRMVKPMTLSIDSFIDNIQKSSKPGEKKIFNVLSQTEILVGEILVRIFFSQDAIYKKVREKTLSLALADFTTSIFARSRSAQNLLFSLFIGENVSAISFTKEDRELKDQIIQIRRIMTEILDNRMSLKDDPEEDFLHNYIEAMRKSEEVVEGQAPQRKITKEQILQQLITFYFAGIDTTGHLLSFALYCLGQYPCYRDRIVQELEDVIPGVKDPNYEQLQKLQFLGKFLDQCLRMWPPAIGVLTRVAREDMKIGPYAIPKGMLVGTNILALMHNPKYYDKPEVFNPDRWDSKAKNTNDPYSFIPFSAGMRSCIGKYLALMETKLIIIKFLNSFDILRTDRPLRLQAKLLYEPIDEDLIYLIAK